MSSISLFSHSLSSSLSISLTHWSSFNERWANLEYKIQVSEVKGGGAEGFSRSKVVEVDSGVDGVVVLGEQDMVKWAPMTVVWTSSHETKLL